ncbi:MAG: hypothetical protein ACJAWY_001758, partial [Sphingomonas echinoides]
LCRLRVNTQAELLTFPEVEVVPDQRRLIRR